MADSLGIGNSTLDKWIVKSRNCEFEQISSDEIDSMSQDKRPQDWTLEERLGLFIACGTLSESEINGICQERRWNSSFER